MAYKFLFGTKSKNDPTAAAANEKPALPIPAGLLQQAQNGYTTQWHNDLLVYLEKKINLGKRKLSPVHCRKLLEQIITWDARQIESEFYHNHYFVMQFIGLYGSFLDDKNFIKDRVEDFFDFSWNNGKSRSYESNKHWQRFLEWAEQVRDETTAAIVRDLCLQIAEDESRDTWCRASCASVIGALGERQRAVQLLLRGVEHKNLDVGIRGFCAHHIPILENIDQSAIERLLQVVEDEKEQEWLRSSCTDALARLKTKDKALSDRLLAVINNSTQSGWLRGAVVEAASPLFADDKAAAARFIEIASDATQDAWVRRGCAITLIEHGYQQTAVEQLLTIVEDEEQDILIRSASTETIGRYQIDDQAVLERMLEISLDNERDILLRRFSIESVGKLAVLSTERAAHAFAHLLNLVQDENQHGILRGAAAETLGMLGIKDKKAAAQLLSLAEDSYQPPLLRRSCIEAVGHLAAEEKSIVTRLLALAADPIQGDGLRGACVEVIEKLGLRDDAVIELLLSLAQDEEMDALLRRTCALVLGSFGWDEVALDLLTELYTKLSATTGDDSRLLYDALWDFTTK